MTKLASVYARSTGLRLSRPNVKKAFFPLVPERYITIQTGSKQPAKNYSLFNEVLGLIRPILAANHISIVHLGEKDDPPLPGVVDLRGQTTFQQLDYVVGRSMCHVGTDSLIAHCAGWNYRPLVVLFGSTSAANHGPYWFDPDKTILLESHRSGGVPTYVMQEQSRTIDFISPESVAASVLKVMDMSIPITQQSRYYGPLYGQAVLEVVPNTCPPPTFCPDLPVICRLDYLHNEEVLTQILRTGRKVNLVTNRPVNPSLLQAFRPLFLSYNHELGGPTEQPSLDYVGAARSLCPRHTFYSRETDPKKLADLRFTYLDVCTIDTAKDTTRDDYLRLALEYLNRPDTPENRLDLERELRHDGGKLRFKSTKYVLSENKVFASFAHVQAGLPLPSLDNNVADVIDSPFQFRDLNHHGLYFSPS